MTKEGKYSPKFLVSARGFVAFPAFFIDEFMRGPEFKNIPSSFWLFLLIIWRDINHHADNTCKKSARRWPIRPETVGRWTAALSVSGLFNVKLGWKDKRAEKGAPTVYTYFDSDFALWEVFITALSQQIAADKKNHHDDTAWGYKCELLLRIIELRKAKGLTGIARWEKDYLNEAGKAGVLKVNPNTRNSEGQLFYSFTAMRSSKDSSGVLSAWEKQYGTEGNAYREPQYDDDGKRIRMYKERKFSEASVAVRKGKTPVPTS